MAPCALAQASPVRIMAEPSPCRRRLRSAMTLVATAMPSAIAISPEATAAPSRSTTIPMAGTANTASTFRI